jgi:hypothetical protein
MAESKISLIIQRFQGAFGKAPEAPSSSINSLFVVSKWEAASQAGFVFEKPATGLRPRRLLAQAQPRGD